MHELIYGSEGLHGDIIYSLRVVKSVGAGYYRLRMDDASNANLTPLLHALPYIKGVYTQHDQVEETYNFDNLRKLQNLHNPHLILTHFRAIDKEPKDWKEPWIHLPRNVQDYAVVNNTGRYQAEGFDWQKEIDYLESKYEYVYFIGRPEEHTGVFEQLIYVPMNNCLEIAQFINNSSMFTGNQSMCLAIAAGLGKPRRQLVGDGHRNCIMDVPEETLINTPRP